jgi:formylglycine-generating enzyme required for sulfatase activity
LQTLAEKATPLAIDAGSVLRPPALVLSIDQGEELFVSEAQDEARPLLALLHDLVVVDQPAVIVIFTIRSDNYERLQLAPELEGVRQEVFSLPPMPRGSYAEVIKGPARRLDGTARSLKIEDGLVDALLSDMESGGATDALPLLAFALERLYDEYHASGQLRLAHYEELGRVKGSIEAAVERALKAADADPTIPKDPAQRLALLRRGLIPWLAGIDLDRGTPRRRVARLSEIPSESRALIHHLVQQRLLTTDIAKDSGETTIEPAHEALLRQWSMLQGWLAEDAALLGVLDGIKRAARDWVANRKSDAWLIHTRGRLEAAEQLAERQDLAANLEPTDRDYLAACRNAVAMARRRRRRVQALIYVLLGGIIIGLLGWINQAFVMAQINLYALERPYMRANVRPYVLTSEAERALKPLASFRECAKDCPEMIVIPPGEFVMGSPESEKDRYDNEGPQHRVTIPRRFAVSKFDVTFADWDACAAVGGCPPADDTGRGRGGNPVINVSWDEAKLYVAWLSRITGQSYRLLSEAEWEYAARGGTTTAYFWGDELGKGNATCFGCGSEWENLGPAPVGSFKPNPFGLYEVLGNVWQWVEDCKHPNYTGAPTDGSVWSGGNCTFHVIRGGAWNYYYQAVRSAFHFWYQTHYRNDGLSFRIARTLLEP